MRRALPVLLALACACGPVADGEPGGPVDDWGFVRDAEHVAFTSDDGTPLRFVLSHPLVVDGRLHLRALTIFSRSDPGLEKILAEERVRIHADGRTWAGRAVLLTSAAEIDPLLPELMRLSDIEATAPRWDPKPERYPGTQVQQWFVRVEVP